MKIFQIIISLLFFSLSCLFAWMGWHQYRQIRRFIKKAIATEAVIIDRIERMHKGTDHYPRVLYTPILEFKDQRGKLQRANARISGHMAHYPLGARLPILYDPQNPRIIRIHRFFELWLAVYASAFLALGFMVGGLLMWMD